MKLNIARKILADVKSHKEERLLEATNCFKEFINSDLRTRIEQFKPWPKMLRYEVHSFKEALPYHDFDIYEVAESLGFKPYFINDLYCFKIANQASSWALDRLKTYNDNLAENQKKAKKIAIDSWKIVNGHLEAGEYEVVKEITQTDSYAISVSSPSASCLRLHPYKKEFVAMAKLAGFKKVEFNGLYIWLYFVDEDDEPNTEVQEDFDASEKTSE